METNVKNADDQINFSEWQIRNYEIILEALENGFIEKDSQQLYIAIEQLGRTYPIEYSNNVWTEMLQNGKTSLIRNEAFRDKLATLNSDLNQTTLAKNDYQELNFEFARLTGEVLSLELRHALVVKFHPTRMLNNDRLPNLPNQKEIINSLKELDGLNGYLVGIYNAQLVNKVKFERHKKSIMELIEICNSELGM